MSQSPARVLVVEDDAAMAAGIVRGLRAAGFAVELSTSGAEGTRLALRGQHDALVLDLMLPDRSGFEVLEALEGRSAAPTIVLTARTELDDRLRCFRLGAADFMAKPFWIEELVARLRSRLGAREAGPKRVVCFADVAIDLDARTTTVGGAPSGLTRNEFDLLAHLVQRPGRAVSREQLAARALDPTAERDARTVDTHVARLRRKLGAAGAAALVTVWGIGYRFAPPEDAA